MFILNLKEFIVAMRKCVAHHFSVPSQHCSDVWWKGYETMKKIVENIEQGSTGNFIVNWVWCTAETWKEPEEWRAEAYALQQVVMSKNSSGNQK